MRTIIEYKDQEDIDSLSLHQEDEMNEMIDILNSQWEYERD
jgi:hypothetical protein